MRILLAVALTLGLCGCSDWNGSFFGDDDSAPPAQAATPAPPAEAPAPLSSSAAPAETSTVAEAPSAPMTGHSRAAGERCTTLARQRASDAAYQGEDEETQRAVYDRTYAGCMDWDAKHAL